MASVAKTKSPKSQAASLENGKGDVKKDKDGVKKDKVAHLSVKQNVVHGAQASTATLSAIQQRQAKQIGKAALLEMYGKIQLIRQFEQRAEQMYQQQRIGGFLHLYMGQEAVGVGMLSALGSEDYTTTSYRDHGIALALGVSPNACMAELFGKSDGVSSGKGGSMHYYSKEKNLLGGHGIVGGQLPIGLGAAFTAKYLNTKRVSMVFFGDGAAHQGVFHETANMAGLWKLPLIMVLENNHYGMGTSVERSSAVTDFTTRGAGYNMEAITLDGMNLLECATKAADIVQDLRANPRPMLIVANTYRYRGHSVSDPANYRSKEEIEMYRKVDPIQQTKQALLAMKWTDEASLKAIDKQAREIILDAVRFAEESPLPDAEERLKDIYAT